MPYIYQAHFDTDKFFKESKTVMSFLQHVWLSSCAVWGKILLIHTMLFHGFILQDVFVTPADISMVIKLQAVVFFHIVSSFLMVCIYSLKASGSCAYTIVLCNVINVQENYIGK